MRKQFGRCRALAPAVIFSLMATFVGCGGEGARLTGVEPPAGPDSSGTVRATAALTVTIRDMAHLVDGGESVRLMVDVTCEHGLNVLEAFVYMSQDGYTSRFAPLSLRCRAATSVPDVVMVSRGFDSPFFHRGEAWASAYVLLLDPATGTTQSGGDGRFLTVR